MIKQLQTRNIINPTPDLLARYPNRLFECVACDNKYLLNLNKTLGKGKYCSRFCSDKYQVRGKWNKGKSHSIETRKKLSEANRGQKSHLWRGGVTEENQIIRSGLEYRVWRKSVFERDDYTCQICNRRGVKLNADHIKPFAYFPELRFEVDNGRTLCVPCHKDTDTYKTKVRTKYPDLATKYKLLCK